MMLVGIDADIMVPAVLNLVIGVRGNFGGSRLSYRDVMRVRVCGLYWIHISNIAIMLEGTLFAVRIECSLFKVSPVG